MEVTAAGTVVVALAAAAWAAAACGGGDGSGGDGEEEATETEAADSEATTTRESSTWPRTAIGAVRAKAAVGEFCARSAIIAVAVESIAARFATA